MAREHQPRLVTKGDGPVELAARYEGLRHHHLDAGLLQASLKAGLNAESRRRLLILGDCSFETLYGPADLGLAMVHLSEGGV
ncbi:MAG: hypothetical protein AB1700_13975 [Bacillota bacterium]